MVGCFKRVKMVAVVSAALLLTNSCAGPTHKAEPPRDFLARDAARVFTAGYDNISEYYLDPVDLHSLAVHGMQGLSQVDPSFAVTPLPDRLQLTVGRAVIGEFPVPQQNDSVHWGMLTAAVILAGRSSSPELAKAEPERLYRTVFEASLKDLDRFSRYADFTTARDNRAQREGFGGIGISLLPDDSQITIANVMKDTPAEQAGLRAGDRITNIDGVLTEGMSVHDVVRHLRGGIHSSVDLSLARPRGHGTELGIDTLHVTLRRARIVPTTVSLERVDDIAVIKLHGFNQEDRKSVV
jgi:carboxyl-terminal processing protease